jgi:hypothetical protein
VRAEGKGQRAEVKGRGKREEEREEGRRARTKRGPGNFRRGLGRIRERGNDQEKKDMRAVTAWKANTH